MTKSYFLEFCVERAEVDDSVGWCTKTDKGMEVVAKHFPFWKSLTHSLPWMKVRLCSWRMFQGVLKSSVAYKITHIATAVSAIFLDVSISFRGVQSPA